MYSIRQLAEIAGISLKTLRHYDEIGLLKPAQRKESGFRYYSRKELLKLQQILFYKELDFSLSEILKLMNNGKFSPLGELKRQKELLIKKLNKYSKLIETIEKTINDLENNKGNNIMLSESELYEGFSKEDAKNYRTEASTKWGEEIVAQSEMRIRKLGKEGWDLLKEKGEQINQELARLMDKYPEHPDVQEQIINFHDYLDNFYEVSPERLLALGRMYVEDERFTAYYEKYRSGLSNFLCNAIEYYVNEKIWKKRNK
jgi:DNA-binding transcriptional MerR regulator